MAQDYGYCWRTVRLYCPSAPTFLAREWVNAAWKQLLGARLWSFLRTEVTLPVLATDTHIVMPPDFGSFRVVVDQARQIRLPFRASVDQLSLTAVAGLPCSLIAATPSTDPLTRGQVRYLLYPSGSACTLTAVYHRQAPRLTDTDVFTGVLADGAEVLVAGALAQAALWPGTADKASPYFNAGLAQAKANEFRLGIQALSLRDDEQVPEDLWDSWGVGCGDQISGAEARSTDVSYA